MGKMPWGFVTPSPSAAMPSIIMQERSSSCP